MDVVRFLLEKEASAVGDFSEARGRAVLEASRHSGAPAGIMRLLLSARAGTEAVKDCDACRTPLCWAAIHGDLGMASLLLEGGADRQHRSENGKPCELARAGGHLEVARLLE